MTIFLVKSKLSTAKKSKTEVFSRVFNQNNSVIFFGKSKMNFWTKNEDFEQCENSSNNLNFFCASRLIFTLRARKQIIIRKLRLSPKRNRLNVDVNLITECLDFGDWKLVYHLLRNMNSETFAEFCEHLTEKLRGELVSQTAQCLKITLKSLTIQRAKRVGLPSITFNWKKMIGNAKMVKIKNLK